jgi:sugar-specific transcriptional regulator TrmB
MNLEKELQEVGLPEKEAKVYIAMLELGRATAQDIAKKADVNRATTYFVMENLMKKGLASAIDEGPRQYFLPEDPSQIEAIFEKKRVEFEAQRERVEGLVSELSAINALKTKKPIVKYYLGKEGILRMAKASFKVGKGHEGFSIFSRAMLDKYIPREDRDRARKVRVNNRVQMKVICNPSDEQIVPAIGDKFVVVMPEKYDLPGDITVYKNIVQLISYTDMTGIVIENEDISKTLKALFDMAYRHIEKEIGEYKTPDNETSS